MADRRNLAKGDGPPNRGVVPLSDAERRKNSIEHIVRRHHTDDGLQCAHGCSQMHCGDRSLGAGRADVTKRNCLLERLAQRSPMTLAGDQRFDVGAAAQAGKRKSRHLGP